MVCYRCNDAAYMQGLFLLNVGFFPHSNSLAQGFVLFKSHQNTTMYLVCSNYWWWINCPFWIPSVLNLPTGNSGKRWEYKMRAEFSLCRVHVHTVYKYDDGSGSWRLHIPVVIQIGLCMHYYTYILQHTCCEHCLLQKALIFRIFTKLKLVIYR